MLPLITAELSLSLSVMPWSSWSYGFAHSNLAAKWSLVVSLTSRLFCLLSFSPPVSMAGWVGSRTCLDVLE